MSSSKSALSLIKGTTRTMPAIYYPTETEEEDIASALAPFVNNLDRFKGKKSVSKMILDKERAVPNLKMSKVKSKKKKED